MKIVFLLLSLFGVLQASESSPKQIAEQLLAAADVKIGGERPWDLQVHDERFYMRVLKEGSLGLGESYMDGWWDCASIDQFIYRVLRAKLDVKPSWRLKLAVLKAKLFNEQDKKGSMVVIDQHYERGNDLYQNMLDGLMTYSCGYWKGCDNLDDAQKGKYDLIARKLQLKKGMRVLDIGCGWGGFAKFIAETYGVSVVGITLSEK